MKKELTTTKQDLKAALKSSFSYLVKENRVTKYLLVASIVCASLVFWDPEELTLIQGLVSGLLGVTGATFAIIGIWLILLNPLSIFDSEEEQDKYKRDLATQLQPYFKLSVGSFASAVSLWVLATIIPPILETFRGILMTSSLEVVFRVIGLVLRIGLGSAIIFLVGIQILVILANLLPLFEIEERKEENKEDKALEALKGKRIRK